MDMTAVLDHRVSEGDVEIASHLYIHTYIETNNQSIIQFPPPHHQAYLPTYLPTLLTDMKPFKLHPSPLAMGGKAGTLKLLLH